MGLFSTNKSVFPWIELTSTSQLEKILNSTGKIVIFKHSIRCSISSFALKNFEREFEQNLNIPCYLLDLINHRDVSNEIADKLNVMHQSPQLFLIENNTVLYTATHEQIDATKIK